MMIVPFSIAQAIHTDRLQEATSRRRTGSVRRLRRRFARQVAPLPASRGVAMPLELTRVS